MVIQKKGLIRKNRVKVKKNINKIKQNKSYENKGWYIIVIIYLFVVCIITACTEVKTSL